MSSLLLKNIGCLITGKHDQPYSKGNTLLAENGVISAVGNIPLVEEMIDVIIDVQGATVVPGLIDSHVHPVLGDYTPRQKMFDFINSSLHGGVTTMISAGRLMFQAGPKTLQEPKRWLYSAINPPATCVLEVSSCMGAP